MQVGPINVDLAQGVNKKDNMCPCCTRSISRSILPLGCTSKQLSHLGPGYPLYFSFYKFSIILTLILFLVSGSYNLFTNIYNGNQCTQAYQAKQVADYKYKCSDDWITVPSVGNKKNEDVLLKIQDILNMSSVVIIIISFQLFRTFMRKIDTLVDKTDISPEDYTILVKNIPITTENTYNISYDVDLKNFLQDNLLPGRTVQITKVNFTFNLRELGELNKRRTSILLQKKAAIRHRYQNGEYKAGQSAYKFDQQLQLVETDIDILSQKFSECKDQDIMKNLFTGWAFVSFTSATDKDDIVNQYSRKNFLNVQTRLQYNGANLKIEHAPSPSDVFWENLHIQNQFLRQTISYVIIAVLLAGSFFLVKYIMELQRKIQTEQITVIYDVQTTLQLSSIVLSFIINTINILFKHFCLFLTILEKQKTRTMYYVSAIKKIVLSQFSVSALVIFGNQMFLVDDSSDSYFEKIFNSGGLVYNIQYVFITNSFINLFLEFINIPGILKSIKRFFATKSCQNGTQYSTQQQLNDMFEDPEFSVVLRYALMLKTIFIMAFYAPIIPVCLPWISLTLAANYWIDKYNLLRRRVVKYNLGLKISVEMTEMLEYALVIYCAGNIFFFVFVIGNSSIESASYYQYISAGLGIFHAAFPMQWLNLQLFKVQPAPPNNEEYQNVQGLFNTDYERQNPATATLSKSRFINRQSMAAMRQTRLETKNIKTSIVNIENDF